MTKRELEKAIQAYSDYIMDNAENNENFGTSWFPVCFDEFVTNEYVDMKGGV